MSEIKRCHDCGHELSQCGPQNDDGEPTLDCLVCQLRDKIKELNRAQQASPWISTATRMPTKEDANKDICAVLGRHRNGDFGLWHLEGSFDNLTMFMPIPPLPKQDEDDGFEKWWRDEYLGVADSTDCEIARSAWKAARAKEKQGG